MNSAVNDPTVYIVDDEEIVRKALHLLVKAEGLRSECFASGQEFLDSLDNIGPGCLLLDISMPDMDGLELQEQLRKRNIELPIVIITGHADVSTAVRALKGGAVEFVEKPLDSDVLIRHIHACLEDGVKRWQSGIEHKKESERLSQLTRRERQVMNGLVAGKRNKQIAEELHISFRTVELHRANIMVKLDANTLSDVVRIALASGKD